MPQATLFPTHILLLTTSILLRINGIGGMTAREVLHDEQLVDKSCTFAKICKYTCHKSSTGRSRFDSRIAYSIKIIELRELTGMRCIAIIKLSVKLTQNHKPQHMSLFHTGITSCSAESFMIHFHHTFVNDALYVRQ